MNQKQESKLALVNNFNGFIVWVVSSPTQLFRSRDLAQVKDGHLLPSVHFLLSDVGFQPVFVWGLLVLRVMDFLHFNFSFRKVSWLPLLPLEGLLLCDRQCAGFCNAVLLLLRTCLSVCFKSAFGLKFLRVSYFSLLTEFKPSKEVMYPGRYSRDTLPRRRCGQRELYFQRKRSKLAQIKLKSASEIEKKNCLSK